MSGDPFRVFREGEAYRREAVKTLWPDLYEALAELDAPKRAWPCPLIGHGTGAERQFVPVVGRLHLNGTPACELHLQSSDRPGGYPLELVENPEQWKRDHGHR